MPLMLPPAPAHARSLAGVAPELLAAVQGESAWGRARSAVLCVIDGLGAIQLRAHAGHARRLSALMTKKSVARSVFPSTTAAALSSIMTGAMPGEHGLVGYRVLDPESGRLVNQLSGWETDGIDPLTWQASPTIFERAGEQGLATFAVGPAEYEGSGFSRAILRGANYVACDEVRERYALALALADQNPGSIVYCYLPEVDKAGHKHGVDSNAWLEALEDIDAAFSPPIPDGVGVVITADHGMIDVPKHRHVLLQADDVRWHGVAQIGGEPRMLHVYLEPGEDAQAAVARWQQASEGTADVATREELITSGLLGEVRADVLPRIGDLVVVTRGLWAFYDDTLADKRAQKMIGQHGSVSPEETIVPLLRAGAFA